MTAPDRARVAGLMAAARQQVEDGRTPACQVALALDGELVAFESFGCATAGTRFAVFSCTKALVAAAAWALMSDRALDVDAPVAEVIPEFGRNGKQSVTSGQLMLHTAGFPNAPMGPPDWCVRDRRVERMATWRLDWAPGTRCHYHATSAHWVLAEILERIGAQDYRALIHSRVTEPLGLPRLLGIPEHDQDDIAEITMVGDLEPAPAAAGAGGLRLPPEVNPAVLLAYNDPARRAVGVPGAGGFCTAADLALFYQALLHDTAGLWDPSVRSDTTGTVRCTLIDDALGVPGHRTLGLMIAGTDGAASRGFGRCSSPRTFGHGGVGGQIAWADPDTGLSFSYLTSGLDRNFAKQSQRAATISDLATVCGAPR